MWSEIEGQHQWIFWEPFSRHPCILYVYILLASAEPWSAYTPAAAASRWELGALKTRKTLDFAHAVKELREALNIAINRILRLLWFSESLCNTYWSLQ